MAFTTLTPENVMSEHLCCAIADKKHQTGVNDKRNWLAERIKEGHIFRKLDAQGKVFIEYAPLEKAWILVTGDNYFYIYFPYYLFSNSCFNNFEVNAGLAFPLVFFIICPIK